MKLALENKKERRSTDYKSAPASMRERRSTDYKSAPASVRERRGTDYKSAPASVVAFRCWSRKKYAAFNSMKKVIKICALCIAYNLIGLHPTAKAQTGNDSLVVKSYEIDDIVVTPGQTRADVLKATGIVTVITKVEIERAPVQSLNDLLKYVTGVDIRQRGPLGAQADISLRGGTFDQTLILLNGVNITDAQTGHHNLNLPIDIESIEQIEVIQGPATKLFGANAFNGVINIVTGNSYPNHIRASASYGQYGFYKTSANISNTTGNISQFISFNYIASNGYIRNTDFKNTNIFYSAGLISGLGKLDLQAGYNKKDFAANSFYSLRFPNQFEATTTEFVSLKYQSNTKIKISANIYLRRLRDRFELRRDTTPFNHHRTTTAGVNVFGEAKTLFGKTTLGVNLRSENIISNVLGETLTTPVPVPGFENDTYTKSYNRLITGVFADHSITFNKLTIMAGVIVYNNSVVSGVRINPGVDLNYRFNDFVTLYTSVNKSLRSPTFTDMFYLSPIQKGNEELVAEEALTLEGGLKYNSPSVNSNISVFRRTGYRMIDWVKDASPDSLIWRSMNHSNINFTGLESSMSFSPPEGSKLERIKSLSISYSFLNADWDYNNMLSRYALDYLKHQISSIIDLRIHWKLYISNRITFNDRNGVFQDKSGELTDYKPFWLADTKLYWQSDHLNVYAEASNLFNTSYYDFGGIVQPGVWVRAGVVVDLDY